MARLMERRNPLLVLADDQRLARNAHQNLVLCAFEIFVRDCLLIHPGGIQGRFVDQIGEVGAGESGRASSDHGNIDIFCQGDLADVNRQDAFAAPHVRAIDDDTAIKAARTKQRRIEHVRSVG